jgi:hypothetical protein
VFLAPLVIASIHGSLAPHIEKLFEGVHRFAEQTQVFDE